MAKLPKYFYFRVKPDKLSITVEDASDVDVAEVVRCAECKWFRCNMRQDGYVPQDVPEWECLYHQCATDVMDYCAYGERKEET